MSTYHIKVTHWHAMSGTVRHQYNRKVEAGSRMDAIQQTWDADPYAHRFEDVTEEIVQRKFDRIVQGMEG